MSETKLTMAQMAARISELEAQAVKAREPGAIHAVPSKAVRDGDKPASIICFQNVNANPQFPLTLHASQFVRFAEQIQVLIAEVNSQRDRFLYRSDEERADVKSRLKALSA